MAITDYFSSDNKGELIFYARPSLGLRLWGPLVPASDCRQGLWTLTGIQFLFGYSLIKRMRHQESSQSALHMFSKPKISILGRVSKVASVLAGSLLIFGSVLEGLRLVAVYDPWYDEAKLARERWIIKSFQESVRGKAHNEMVSLEVAGVAANTALQADRGLKYWFGPLDFKPMSLAQWLEKKETFIERTKQMKEMLKKNKVTDEVSTVMQSNKVTRDSIYESLVSGAANYAVEKRPGLVLPQSFEKIEDLEDMNDIWDFYDPWQMLREETNMSVRLFPTYRSTKEVALDGDIKVDKE